MNTTEPIEIDFLDFFKTGKFDCLELGQNKEWILKNFPHPDSQFDDEMMKNGFDIWTYGGIELHFEKEILFLIYSDHWYEGKFKDLDELKFKKWIFDDLSKLNLLFVLQELNNHNIDYKKKTDDLGVLIRLNSGIEMTFENPDDDNNNPNSNDFEITSFGLIAENANRWK